MRKATDKLATLRAAKKLGFQMCFAVKRRG